MPDEDEVPYFCGPDPLPEHLRGLYQRALPLARFGWCGNAIRAAVGAQAEHDGFNTDEGLDVALRVTNAPEADPHNAIVCAATPGNRFLSESITRPGSVLGDGLLLAGDVGILYGRPGFGKSWLHVQLAAAAVGGCCWLGFTVQQARVGVISLEGHDFFLKRRLEIALRELYGDDWLVLAGDLSILTRRRLGRPLGLLEDAPAIARWIAQERLGLVLPDPLSKLHRVRETAEELGPVIEAAEEIASSTQAAILISHHERKPPSGRNSGEEDLDAIRGTTRLITDPRLLIRLKAVPGHPMLRVLVFPKVSYAAPPEPIYLRTRDDLEGYLEPVEKPASGQKADRRREDLRHALQAAGSAGLSRTDGECITGLRQRGALKAFHDVGAVSVGSGPTSRWYHVDFLPGQPLPQNSRLDTQTQGDLL